MTVTTAGLVLALTVASAAAARAQRPAHTGPLVFDGVTVVDVQDGKLLPGQRVVIQGNRIKSVGSVKTVKAPAGAQVVDARGKYLIPGLWDMHVHGKRYTDIFYPLFVANGVTGIRDAGSNVPLDTLRLWRRNILAGTRVGPPRQLLSGPALYAESLCPKKKAPKGLDTGHLICITDPVKVIDSLKAAGADVIKAYFLTKEMYFAAAAESKRVGLPLGGHLEFGVYGLSAIEASDSGAKLLDHMQSAGDLGKLCLGVSASIERCQPVAERFRKNGTWWVPTLSVLPPALVTAMGVPLNMLGSGVGFPKVYGPASQATITRMFQFAKDLWGGSTQYQGWLSDSVGAAQTPIGDSAGFAIVRRVGMPILAGTDNDQMFMKLMPPGFSLHVELALLVREGLSPLEALQAATLNPAKFLHGTDSLGTVTPGKLADLVLLDADPLQDITNTTKIRAVVANGRYFDRVALDRLIADAQAKVKQTPALLEGMQK